MVPITEDQARAVVDGLFAFVEARESPVAAAVTKAFQAVVDEVGMDALWAFLRAEGVVK